MTSTVQSRFDLAIDSVDRAARRYPHSLCDDAISYRRVDNRDVDPFRRAVPVSLDVHHMEALSRRVRQPRNPARLARTDVVSSDLCLFPDACSCSHI
jgi:hypothetical protein